jgi:Leucine rich repeat
MDDRAIVARLKATPGITEEKEDYDDLGCVIELNYSGLGITYLPDEVGLLTNLQGLDLSDNQLTQIPVELAQLSKLQGLDLSYNPDLLTPPPEIVA